MLTAALGSVSPFSCVMVEPSAFPITLFCDFDGPIVDVSDRYYHTYQLGLTEIQASYQQQGVTLPVHYLSKAQFWQMKQERMPDVEIAMRSGLQGQQIEQFLERVKQIVNQPNLLERDQLQQGVKRALTLLHRQGVRLVLVTLRQQEQATQMLRDHGLERLFSQIWGAKDDYAAYANQADHKTRLLKQAIDHCVMADISLPTTFSESTAWMLGDTEADVLAGQATGIPTIALTCGIRSRAYLQRFQPTHIHPNLLSAAQALMGYLPSAA